MNLLQFTEIFPIFSKQYHLNDNDGTVKRGLCKCNETKYKVDFQNVYLTIYNSVYLYFMMYKIVFFPVHNYILMK